jgi:hypothetical protein
MLRVNFPVLNPPIVSLKEDSQIVKQKILPALTTRQPVRFTADNVKANFLPSLAFTGIHKDAVIGIDTKIVGISKYQDNAKRLYYRLDKRKQRGDKEKVQLALKLEDGNKYDKNAIAVYHVYGNKPAKLGYLNKDVSKRIRPMMEDGHAFTPSVIYAAGGDREGFPYIGVRMRLEYLSNPERSPNERTLKKVRQAFKDCLKDGSALAYREEQLIESKKYDRATKMKIDTERGEVTVYRMGWEQLQGPISDPPGLRNQRNHSQNPDFVDHSEGAVKALHKKLKAKEK